MRRSLRTAALLLALPLLLDCREAVQPTPNGDEIGSWTLPDLKGDATGDHKQSLDLPDGVKIDLAFTAGTIPHDSGPLRTVLSASVLVVDAAGTDVRAAFSTAPLHFAGDPLDERSLDLRVTTTRDTSGCTRTGFESRTTRLRLRPDGKAETIQTEAAAPPPNR